MKNEKDVIELYLQGYSMREIARKLNTNHKLISRILKRNNIEIRKPKYLRGKRKFNDIDLKYNNMKCHLRFDVELEWLKQFDFDKLKCLNDMISKTDRWDIDAQWNMMLAKSKASTAGDMAFAETPITEIPEFAELITSKKTDPHMKAQLIRIVKVQNAWRKISHLKDETSERLKKIEEEIKRTEKEFD